MDRDYSDMLDMPHHVSIRHPRMSMDARAAQFAPFAALSGYGDAVDETVRRTDNKIDIDDGLKEALNNKLLVIKDNIKNKPIVEFTYFIPDQRKSGGMYKTISGKVRKIDDYKHIVIMDDKLEIPIDDIINITSNVIEFDNYGDYNTN